MVAIWSSWRTISDASVIDSAILMDYFNLTVLLRMSEIDVESYTKDMDDDYEQQCENRERVKNLIYD